MTQPLSIAKGGNLPLSWPFKSRQFNITINTVWDKIFKSGLSKVCGRQLLKNLRRYGLSSTKFT